MRSSRPTEPGRGLRFEELAPGQRFEGPGITVTEADIIDFARTWDPQPFHVDRQAATDSVFGGLVGSGLQTILLSYWLYLRTGLLEGTALAGIGMDEVRFLRPLMPDRTLRVRITILETTPTRRPDRGRVRLAIEAFDDEGEGAVLRLVLIALVAAGQDPGPA